MISTDVAKIIISYGKLYELESLFVTCNFNFNLEFKYDASTHYIIDARIKTVFSKFMRIRLIGLAVYLSDSTNMTKILNDIGMDKCICLEKLIFCGNGDRSVVNLLGLEKCYKISFFKAKDCSVKNIYTLSTCLNIKYIDVLKCNAYYRQDNIHITKNFNKLYFLGCSNELINTTRIDEISFLKHLSLRCTNIEKIFKHLNIKSMVFTFSTAYNGVGGLRI